MADRLREDEQRIQNDRRDRRERELGRGEGGARRARRERRKNEADGRERDDRREGSRGALGIEGRDVPPQGGYDEAEPDDSVAGDHRGGEDGVPGKAVGLRSSRGHEGDDEPGLDDRYRDGKDQRAEGLAHAVRDDLRVVHRGEDGAGEHDRHHEEDGISRLLAPRRRQREQCDDGDDEQPGHGTREPARPLGCSAHRAESTVRDGRPPRAWTRDHADPANSLLTGLSSRSHAVCRY
jgi:hypothetical protein